MKAFAALLAVLLIWGACGASEWPTLRHDSQRTGSSEGHGPLLPEIAWSVYAGAMPTPPSVSEHAVYFGVDNVMYAVSAFNGSGLWGVEVDGMASPPTVYDQEIYFGTSSGAIYCLNAKNGATVWINRLSGGITEPVAVINGFVYACTLDGQVYALNSSTGGLIWQKSLNGSPLAPAAVEAVLVVATREGEVTAFDRNGGVMWKRSFEDGITYGPAIHNGGVWFATGKKLFVMENGNVEKVLEFQASITSFSLKDGEAYVCLEDGTVRSVKDGEVGWSFTSPAGTPHSLAVAENTIFVSCGNRLFCLEHGTGEAIWETCIRGDSLAVAYGKIFMTSEDGGIYCIGSWGKAQNESFIAGLAYICAAAVLAFLLYMLGRKTGKRR